VTYTFHDCLYNEWEVIDGSERRAPYDAIIFEKGQYEVILEDSVASGKYDVYIFGPMWPENIGDLGSQSFDVALTKAEIAMEKIDRGDVR